MEEQRREPEKFSENAGKPEDIEAEQTASRQSSEANTAEEGSRRAESSATEDPETETAKSDSLKSDSTEADADGSDGSEEHDTETDTDGSDGAQTDGSEGDDTEADTNEPDSTQSGDSEADGTGNETEEEDGCAESDAKKKGFFRRDKKKDKKDEAIEELTDKNRRLMAEFDNFRKRSEKEKSSMYEIGAKSVVEKILPVVDNFERGLATLSPEEKKTSFAEGMEKVYRQMMTTLEAMDVRPIEAVGKEFDPDFHNAVMHVEDENYGENIIVQEFQKGYTYRDSVVRHSMVQVAN